MLSVRARLYRESTIGALGLASRFGNLNWEFNTASEPSGGVHGLYLYGWGNTNE